MSRTGAKRGSGPSARLPRSCIAGCHVPERRWLHELVQREIENWHGLLFQRLTGSPLHLYFHAVPQAARKQLPAPTCPAAGATKKHRIPGRCWECLRTNWQEDTECVQARRFVGACGLVNAWIDLCVAGAAVGRLVIQRKNAESRAEPWSRSVLLLQLVAHDLEYAVEAAVLRRELVQAKRAQMAMRFEDARIRCHIRQRLPSLPGAVALPESRKRTWTTVQQMLDFVHHNYTRPLTLKELSHSLGMSRSYLSSIFARTTGLSFHKYLDELRLAKACALLRDPLKTVAEVACEAGYASEDWFRHAFKSHTGLSPSDWRHARAPQAAAPAP